MLKSITEILDKCTCLHKNKCIYLYFNSYRDFKYIGKLNNIAFPDPFEIVVTL